MEKSKSAAIIAAVTAFLQIEAGVPPSRITEIGASGDSPWKLAGRLSIVRSRDVRGLLVRRGKAGNLSFEDAALRRHRANRSPQ